MGYLEYYKDFEKALLKRTKMHYGKRLISFVVFGSVARGMPRPDSDVDILVIAENLPRGRLKRAFEFQKAVEYPLEKHIKNLHKRGINITISPLFKLKEEVERGSPLFFDMLYHVKILFDKGKFFAHYLDSLRYRLDELGARRVQRGNAWYWILKPDYKFGDIIEL